MSSPKKFCNHLLHPDIVESNHHICAEAIESLLPCKESQPSPVPFAEREIFQQFRVHRCLGIVFATQVHMNNVQMNRI
jgi:hypothetical protein